MGLKTKFAKGFFLHFSNILFVSYFDVFQISTASKLLPQFEKKEDSEASFFHGLCEHFDIWNNLSNYT